MKNKTAILIFANSAEKELTSKSISSSDFFNLLDSDTVKTVQKTNLPYFHFSEKEQIGSSFGERFTNAIEAVFNKGFEHVISLGNDIPHLRANHILKATQNLATSDYVLGPSTDGGFYLMGFKKAHFNKTSFQNLPWQTAKLRQRLNTELQYQNESVSYLEMLTDIDNVSDIDSVLESFKTLDFKIKRLLLLLRKTTKTIVTSASVFQYVTVFKSPYNKGSPILLHI
ncbi:hypothetical protein DFQ09_101427 [Winogradskyella pacifica]|uniref:DUF2064 domain-containing protein n=1 Tax=Winogradskyella pacifica TaxID=664642 RepID=A0A3D9N629_9FLAO|nr:DUF2064 domain-containing protein [Winogradskyella pacifica]REE27593.1 hypothetical protein DFQ09_101427 [Winogradskyella pacifica]